MDKRRTGFLNGVTRQTENRDLIEQVLRAKRKLAEAAETVRVA